MPDAAKKPEIGTQLVEVVQVSVNALDQKAGQKDLSSELTAKLTTTLARRWLGRDERKERKRVQPLSA